MPWYSQGVSVITFSFVLFYAYVVSYPPPIIGEGVLFLSQISINDVIHDEYLCLNSPPLINRFITPTIYIYIGYNPNLIILYMRNKNLFNRYLLFYIVYSKKNDSRLCNSIKHFLLDLSKTNSTTPCQ